MVYGQQIVLKYWASSSTTQLCFSLFTGSLSSSLEVQNMQRGNGKSCIHLLHVMNQCGLTTTSGCLGRTSIYGIVSADTNIHDNQIRTC